MSPRPVTSTALLAGGDAVTRLDTSALTAGIRGSAGEAAQAVAELLESRLQTGVAVLTRAGATWSVTAGGLDLADGSAAGGPSVDRNPGLAWLGDDQVAVGVPSELMTDLREDDVRSLAVWVSLHLSRDLATDSAREAVHEANVLRAVTEQLRSVPDLDQVLHSIARRTLDLLDADICGVLLVDDDDVLLMRSCVGHRAAETAKLTMRRGQGVAGLVFATGTVQRVDDYLASETISQDFMTLASREETRSALAVPLTLGGDLIGVLEVWRRRASVFSDRDVQRLLTLADFATIAIANARLYEEQEQMLAELSSTREALEREVHLSRRVANLQGCLIEAVLKRPTLAALAEVVADELGCAVGIYGPEGQRIAAQADRDGTRPPETLDEAVTAGAAAGVDPSVRLRPVVVEGERLGAVLLLGREEAAGLLEVACGQVAMAISLAHLHERAASRARAEALEQAMWDLLSGPIESRMAARSRAQQMGFVLAGAHLVVYGRLNNLRQLAPDASSLDSATAEIVRAVKHCDDTPRHTLVSARGDHVAVVVPAAGELDVRWLIGTWSAAARAVVADLSITWGVSRVHEDAFSLAKGFDEAQVALTAALRLGGQNVAIYDELGIVRLLLGSGSDPDLHAFIEEVTGPLVAYDEAHDGSLVLTLRAYFDANCSQKLASERLFIHHKTMRYRLERIRQLTGLDLNQHEDRLRADFALRILQVNEPESTD